MAVIFNPKFLNQPQQVGKNKVDIEKLKSQVSFICNTQNELAEDATSVLREETDVGIKPIENSVILSRNGNVFKIEGTSEDQTILYLKFYASLKGPEGEAGATGATGPQGVQGIQGPRGEVGATGATGPQGATGETGPRGPQGEQGIQGPIGPQGPKGDTGPRGIQGVQGVKGDTGATGPQGPQGLTGIQGPQGPQGLTGATGATGATGPQGPQGIQGPKGDKGDAGNSFLVTGSVVSVNDLPPASTTPAGTAYFVGGTYPRPVYVVVESEGVKIWQNEGTLQGPEGPQGPIGPTGATGATGPQGPQGIQGEQGEQGIQGPTGATGPTGPVGPQGPQGEQGVQGPQGDDGEGFNFMGEWDGTEPYYINDTVTYVINGTRSAYVAIQDNLSIPPTSTAYWQPFATGVKGDTGATGETGPQGPTGPQGATGETGPQGPQGEQGIQGPEGPSGIVSVQTSGSGNAITSVSYSATTKILGFKKDLTFLTSAPVTSVSGRTGAVTTTQLVADILTGATNRGDLINLKTMGANGHITFQSGLKIAWGFVNHGSSAYDWTANITFGITFNYNPTVVSTPREASGSGCWSYVYQSLSTTGCTLRQTSKPNANGKAQYLYWVAIGY